MANLIRCEWCGMSYDGDRHDNCPHCLAPRTDVVEEHVREEVVLYADGVEYVRIGGNPGKEATTT